MDTVTIATAAVAFLVPYLAEGSKAAARQAGEALWKAMEQRFKSQPVGEEALRDLKTDPQDSDIQAALRLQLRKALTADPEFLAELVRLLEEAQGELSGSVYHATLRDSGAIAQGPGAVAAGAGGVAVGGSVRGGVIVTSDHE